MESLVLAISGLVQIQAMDAVAGMAKSASTTSCAMCM